MNWGVDLVSMALFLWLWRLWKWLVRLLTGKCELYRLCYWKAPLEQKTQRIGA